MYHMHHSLYRGSIIYEFMNVTIITIIYIHDVRTSAASPSPPSLERCPSRPTRVNQYLRRDQSKLCEFTCSFGVAVFGWVSFLVQIQFIIPRKHIVNLTSLLGCLHEVPWTAIPYTTYRLKFVLFKMSCIQQWFHCIAYYTMMTLTWYDCVDV